VQGISHCIILVKIEVMKYNNNINYSFSLRKTSIAPMIHIAHIIVYVSGTSQSMIYAKNIPLTISV